MSGRFSKSGCRSGPLKFAMARHQRHHRYSNMSISFAGLAAAQTSVIFTHFCMAQDDTSTDRNTYRRLPTNRHHRYNSPTKFLQPLAKSTDERKSEHRRTTMPNGDLVILRAVWRVHV